MYEAIDATTFPKIGPVKCDTREQCCEAWMVPHGRIDNLMKFLRLNLRTFYQSKPVQLQATMSTSPGSSHIKNLSSKVLEVLRTECFEHTRRSQASEVTPENISPLRYVPRLNLPLFCSVATKAHRTSKIKLKFCKLCQDEVRLAPPFI